MILIADDSAPMRRTIRTMLAESGQKFLECSSGEEAVELYSRYHPDWVLMDIRMKPMDGITATRKLKAADPSARVIIVTNYDDPFVRREAMDAGAVAFVRKDDLSILKTVLKEP
jgi:two-component system chemotaxis response regulator CheY